MTESIRTQVAVLGGGAAGALAALAARRAGAEVTLVTGAPGATALSSGAVDLAAGFDTLPGHPLALLGRPEVHRLAGEVAAVLCAAPGIYRNRACDAEPALVPTAFGRLHRAWTCQVAQADLNDWAGQRVAVADIAGSSLPAWLVAGELGAATATAGLETHVEAVLVTLDLPPELDVGRSLLVARALDDATLASRVGQAIGEAIAGRDVDMVLIPPWCGLDETLEVAAVLAERAGVPVLEVLGSPGDAPGLRLVRLLERSLAAAGVERLAGKAAATELPAPRGARLERVAVHRSSGDPAELRAEAFVLATGGLAGGGLVLDAALTESVFGLDLELAGAAFVPPSSLFGTERVALFAEHISGTHPACRAGAPVDAALRPLAGTPGEPVCANLCAAGALLAEHDPATDGCGLGTALITGWYAGEQAARICRE